MSLFLFFLKKWANPGFFLFIFVLFSLLFQYKLKKHRCVLEIRTGGRRMVGADETTELWLPPEFISLCLSFLCSFISRYKTKLLVTGFELRICGVGSDRSTNCATTIMARSYQKYSISPKLFLFEDFLLH